MTILPATRRSRSDSCARAFHQWSLFGLVGLGWALHAEAAQAATLYVATAGDDGASGATPAEAFRTIRRAIVDAVPGDTVIIGGGTYTGFENQINPTRSGMPGAFITFRAADGELPILEPPPNITGGSGFEPLDTPVAYIRVEGLAVRNWPSSGFSNGFNAPSSNIEIRHCIAEGNGINGIAAYFSSNFLIEYNIVAHNGNRPPSWSSGVNLFSVTGSSANNVVRGNVSFENVDICGDPNQHPCDDAQSTDGNGFILDQGSTGALFENNIGFRNGGSCLRFTNSSGGTLINNSCYHNNLDTGYAFTSAEVFFSDNASRTNLVVRNNVVAAIAGRDAVNFTTGTNATFATNLWVDDNGPAPFFTAPAGSNPDFRPLATAANVLDQALAGAPASDIGFDHRCVRQQAGQAVAFWQYAPDYDYIRSIGGIASCFHPAARPQGAAADLGAYEFSTVIACATAADCDDGRVCTSDVCGGTGQCNYGIVPNCCTAPADCDDGDPCTAEACDAATGACSSTPVADCCTTSSACEDGNVCTVDACNLATGQCTSNLISRCCASDADCTSPSACVGMVCDASLSACRTQPVAGCCAGPADCNDGDACSEDSCDVSTGTCSNAPIAGCCALDGDCADSDPCTTDRCDAASGRCAYDVATTGACAAAPGGQPPAAGGGIGTSVGSLNGSGAGPAGSGSPGVGQAQGGSGGGCAVGRRADEPVHRGLIEFAFAAWAAWGLFERRVRARRRRVGINQGCGHGKS